VLFGCFSVIWGIEFIETYFYHSLEHHSSLGEKHADTYLSLIKGVSIFVSIIIVLFNKFALGKIIHHIVD
jgi:hypothetical protein